MIVESTKLCGGKHGCGQVLPVRAFSYTKNGFQTYCRKCGAAAEAIRREENPDSYRMENLIAKKAYSLKRSAHKLGPSDIDYEWIMERLDRGVCEKSGEPFVYGHARHPGGPSIDRIDASRPGHMKDNCRVVLWCLNAFKGSSSEEVFDEYLRKISAVFGKSQSRWPAFHSNL